MKLPAITDGERDTLLMCLDVVIQRIDERCGRIAVDTIDTFALRLSRRKVDLLRTKLFPTLRKAVAT